MYGSCVKSDRISSLLTCRVPVYGGMRFLDRTGVPGAGLTSVISGASELYRRATKARAQWAFPQFNESMLDADGNLIWKTHLLHFVATKVI